MSESYRQKAEENLTEIVLGLGLMVMIGALGASATLFDGGDTEEGPVAEYRFDTGADDVAYDTEGNNDGTVNGAEWTSGLSGKDLSFDGNNDYVQTSYGGDPSQASLSAWVKTDSSMQNNFGSIISSYGAQAGGRSYAMLSNGNGGIRFHTSSTSVDSSRNLNSGEWYHVVSTWDGNTGKIYINGELDTSSSSLSSGSNNIDWEIGRSPRGTNYFDGEVDEARIYSRPLNASRVRALYEAGSHKIGPGGDKPESLIQELEFQGENSTDVYDTSGNENHARAQGNAEQAKTLDCKVGRCYRFDGSSSTGLDMEDVWSDHTKSRTFMFWFKEAEQGASTDDRIISQGCSEWFCLVDKGQDQISLLYDGGGGNNVQFPVDQDSWHHASIVFDESTADLRFYLDGKKELETSYGSSWSHSTRPVVLGGNTGGTDDISGNHWEGVIDQVGVFNESLTDTEIWKLYTYGRDQDLSTKGPVARYPIQSRSSPLTDVSGEGNDGNLSLLGEVGSFNSSDGEWKRIRFERDYENPVVVGTSNTLNGEPALSFEAKQVLPGSAKLRLCESEGESTEGCDTHGTEKSSYMVVSASATEDIPGIESGTVNIDGDIDSKTELVSYSESFGSAPNVMANVNSDNGRNPVEARVTSFSGSNFRVGICYQNSTDGCDSSHVTEEIGYVALEPGNLPFQETAETGKTGNSVSDSSFTPQSFSNTYQDPAAVVSTVSNDGGEDASIDEAGNLDSTSIEVRYCEIENGDTCDSHPSENVAWFVAEEGLLTYTNGNFPRYTKTTFRRALSFDGTDDSVEVGEPAGLTDGFLQDSVTMTAEVNPDQCTGTHGVLGKSSNGNNDNYRIWLNSDCSVSVYLDGAGGTKTTSQTLETDSWTHIAATYNGTRRKIYLDGKLARSDSASGVIADASGSPFALASRGGDSEFFDGEIAGARVYPYGLSAEQVKGIAKGVGDDVSKAT